ncbi:hypothetical protein [Shimia sp.]|uniref:hypothetical protein n=1 Tax=Shimia sp. TaxID=1954381 RepID=UPI003BA8A4E7
MSKERFERAALFWGAMICFAPSDEGGSGGGAGADGGGEDTAPGAGGADTIPAAGGNDGAGDGAKWWEGNAFSDEHRTNLTALGLTVDDPLQAIPKLLDMEQSAKKRLGASPDQLITKPKDGQSVADWLKEHGDTFGIPKDAESYEVARPESWPKDRAWDEAFESEARKIAHEEGVPASALNKFVEIFAGKMAKMEGESAEQLEASNTQMMADLSKDWGQQMPAKLAMAKQAMSAIAEKAGFDESNILSVASVLTEKAGGDANAIRLFATIGEMMGEDSLVVTPGGAGLGQTPAEARAELQRLRSPGGDYYEAAATGDTAKLKELQPRIEALTKLAT